MCSEPGFPRERSSSRSDLTDGQGMYLFVATGVKSYEHENTALSCRQLNGSGAKVHTSAHNRLGHM